MTRWPMIDLLAKQKNIIKDEQNKVKRINTKTQVIEQLVLKIEELKEEAKISPTKLLAREIRMLP